MHTAHYNKSFIKMKKCVVFSLAVKLVYLILILENMEQPFCITEVLPTYCFCCRYYREKTLLMHEIVLSE